MLVGSLATLNLITLALRTGVPESPAFLLKKGKLAEANAVVEAMAQENVIFGTRPSMSTRDVLNRLGRARRGMLGHQ